jgi:hypothetical protein
MPKQTLVVDETMTIKEAAFYLKCSPSKVRNLREEMDPQTGKPYLESIQPGRFHVLILTASAVRYKEAIKDPDFWRNRPASATTIIKRQK